MISRGIFKLNKQDEISFSLSELIILIDQIQNPCLIYNNKSKKILCGNLELVKITGFGNHELNLQDVNNLIPEYFSLNSEEEMLQKGFLVKRNQKNIPISYKKRQITDHGDVSIISIVPEENNELKHGASHEINSQLLTLFNIGVTGNFEAFLLAVIESTRDLFGSIDSAIYLKEESILTRKNKSRSFPKKLPIIEVERLQNIDFWSLGKRVLCETHRIGRKKGFTSILTVPIRSEKSICLFVAAVEDQNFFINNKEKIEMFFNWVRRFFDYTIKIGKFQKEVFWLQNQSNMFSKFIDHASDLLLIVNDENIIEFASDPFLRLMQYSSFEVLNKSVHDYIIDKSFERLLQEVDNEFLEINSPILIHDRAGSDYFMSISMCKISQMDMAHKIIIFTDLSKEVMLTKSINTMQKKASLGEVIADFAHEVRNPINNISTGLQMVRKLNSENKVLVDAMDRMQTDCIRMNDLMESILSFSRQNNSEFKKIDLASVIETVYKRFNNKFNKYKINASFTNQLEETRISGDVRSLEQVFINLINNSIDAMLSDGGELAILMKSNSEDINEIEVSIADTGSGIPEDILENIFEPFVSGKKKGTGLGLAITKRIIESHKGRVEIDSFTSGTIFRLFFTKYKEESK